MEDLDGNCAQFPPAMGTEEYYTIENATKVHSNEDQRIFSKETSEDFCQETSDSDEQGNEENEEVHVDDEEEQDFNYDKTVKGGETKECYEGLPYVTSFVF